MILFALLIWIIWSFYISGIPDLCTGYLVSGLLYIRYTRSWYRLSGIRPFYISGIPDLGTGYLVSGLFIYPVYRIWVPVIWYPAFLYIRYTGSGYRILQVGYLVSGLPVCRVSYLFFFFFRRTLQYSIGIRQPPTIFQDLVRSFSITIRIHI